MSCKCTKYGLFRKTASAGTARDLFHAETHPFRYTQRLFYNLQSLKITNINLHKAYRQPPLLRPLFFHVNSYDSEADFVCGIM